MTAPESTPSEFWRPVVGYEGFYEVSNLGRVRRVGRAACLSLGALVRGYPRVPLSRDGVCRRCYVHVLVAQAFLGPCPAGQEVNHKDLNRTNARLYNLEYVTRLENMRHALINGQQRRGGKARRSGLSDQDVREIRASSEKPKVLAGRYGVTLSYMCRLVKGQRWRPTA